MRRENCWLETLLMLMSTNDNVAGAGNGDGDDGTLLDLSPVPIAFIHVAFRHSFCFLVHYDITND